MPKTDYHIILRGEVGYWNFSADQVSYVVNKHKAEPINILISSLGGFVNDAMEISAILKEHGNVNVHYIGMNASAATIASMGASHISMDVDALYLVHKCKGLVFDWAEYSAEQLELRIKELQAQQSRQEAIDTAVAAMYARRCKKSVDELTKLMEKDTWLSAQEALDWGFVDEITDDPQDKCNPSEEEVAAITASGVPMPEQLKKKSFFSKLLDAIEGMIRKEQPINSINMDNYPNTESAAGSQVLTSESQATLTQEQMGNIEKAITDLSETVRAQASEIAQLTERVSQLSQRPAEPAPQVMANATAHEVSALDRMIEAQKDAKEMYNQLT